LPTSLTAVRRGLLRRTQARAIIRRDRGDASGDERTPSEALMLGPRARVWVVSVMAAALLRGTNAWAGPPFLTDDPEPVPFKHWEFYLASQWDVARHEATGTAPHIEVNYGVLPNLQLHTIVPAALAWSDGRGVEYGPGDIELGTKLRFVEEGAWRPQIGVFPLLTVPTGSKARGLGAGAVEAFLPLWIQKSVGAWTTYGGGGVRLAGDGDALALGWLVQRELAEAIALGVEVYVSIPVNGDSVRTQTNLGAVINLSDLQHVLVSGGPSFGTDAFMQAYLAYQLTD
jgi:hypothetical protein